MSILAGILGRRQRVVRYRTIDGGHPAPYPDMTDEQLYNYETTFNVPHRTFAQPPGASSAPAAVDYAPRAAHWGEPNHEPQLLRPERLRRNAAFDAPRYTRKRAGHPAQPASEAEVTALDFSRPIRTITTRQPVEVITTRARHPLYKVHAYIGDADVVTVFTLDGRLSENGPRFLENVPQQREIYLNIHPQVGGGYRVSEHASRDEADAAAGADRLACVAIQRHN